MIIFLYILLLNMTIGGRIEISFLFLILILYKFKFPHDVGKGLGGYIYINKVREDIYNLNSLLLLLILLSSYFSFYFSLLETFVLYIYFLG